MARLHYIDWEKEKVPNKLSKLKNLLNPFLIQHDVIKLGSHASLT
jgi:hypothetical protein